jgi:hypothetical protein
MKSLIENIFLLIIVVISFLLFTTCKKYTENNLWFKNPYKVSIINGKITEYKVNGIDSLPFLNVFYKPYIPNSIHPYNKIDRNITNEQFNSLSIAKGHWELRCDLFEHLNCVMQKDKKTIRIGGLVDTIYYKKQLFIDTKGIIDWQILYLDKKGKSKIKTTFNGNTYEITFQN